METPLHGHKGGDHSGLWAPKEKILSRKVRFLLLLAPMTVRKILSFFSDCLQCHKKLLKVAIISNNQLLHFFCAYKQAGIVHQQLYMQHTPSPLSFGNWVYKRPIYLNQQLFFQIAVNSGRINRGEVNITIFSLRTGLNLLGYPSLRFFLHLILKYFKNYFEIDLSLGINTRSTSTFYCSVIIKSTIDTIVYFLYRFCKFS